MHPRSLRHLFCLAFLLLWPKYMRKQCKRRNCLFYLIIWEIPLTGLGLLILDLWWGRAWEHKKKETVHFPSGAGRGSVGCEQAKTVLKNVVLPSCLPPGTRPHFFLSLPPWQIHPGINACVRAEPHDLPELKLFLQTHLEVATRRSPSRQVQDQH